MRNWQVVPATRLRLVLSIVGFAGVVGATASGRVLASFGSGYTLAWVMVVIALVYPPRLILPGGDPGAADEAAKKGSLSLSLGTGWAKSLAFTTGQCPVMKYNYGLMQAILHDRVHIADNVNAKAITLEDAPRGYKEFDAGAATKYVLNPNGYLDGAAA